MSTRPSKLRQGRNVIAVRASNDKSIAGLVLRLDIQMDDGTRKSIVTDPSWRVASDVSKGWRKIDFVTTGWHMAHSFGKLGTAPWGPLPLDPSARPKILATLPENITAAEGFQVELLCSVPKERQGSWVCMTPDPQGRLIVSDQFGGLYRVTPGKDIDSTKVEKLSVKIGHVQGLLCAYNSLYVSVNGDAVPCSGFYRVRDTDGDDQYDEVKLLKKFNYGGEHGPHAIRLGPDGLLYIIAGNHTKVPGGMDPQSPHRNWAEDLLLPRNPDGRGHATGFMSPAGWILRTDKDGKKWELFCAGFRNPYDIAFNQDGELFTYDADMEFDTGAPWYRPTRINHCVSAAEYGWRYGTGKWPEYFPDSLGAVVDIGLGSPAGIEFGIGAKFPGRYQRALFINDWTYGKVYAVHLQQQGASYTATFEPELFTRRFVCAEAFSLLG